MIFSEAFGVNSLPNASSIKLLVHRSPGGSRLIVRAFITPVAVPTSTVFDPSIGPQYLSVQIVNPEGPAGGWMGLLIEPTHMEDEDEDQENEKENERDGEECKVESRREVRHTSA